MSAIVVVESPSKAKTIQKYLGSSYKVMASYGHIRDLPSKNGSVKPEEDFAMEWELLGKSKRNTDALIKALKNADALYLATDPDREGEAISWHILEILREKYPKNTMSIYRVVFNAITKKTVKEAFDAPRSIDMQLVEAYLARRSLDYLVGFGLSPVLWRKLPGSKSAGRVQSVALRLISEREREIETFIKKEYWSLDAFMTTEKAKKPFEARLTTLENEKVEKFSFPDEAAAKKAAALVRSGKYSVAKVESKPVKRNPSPPFMTSTLQQEASRKIGMSATKTMRTAQQLYEGVDIGGETVGLITYMRTDGLDIIPEALTEIRGHIGEKYGDKYLPKAPRIYKTKAKNAQEAHEAIRPTSVSRTPDSLKGYLDADQLKLYTLIWKRTVACQMSSAEFAQKTIDMKSENPAVTLRATGSTLTFDGFLCLYQEGRDDGAKDENEEKMLPPLNEGDAVDLKELKEVQHFTEPPPRYSEATLVKKLEELGIGRPSTYAAIMQVLQDRSYVRLEKKRFFAEERGRLVITFLKSFFTQYVEYDFTANLEEELDDISNGKRKWTEVLHNFWNPFSGKLGEASELKSENVLKALEDELGNHYFKNEKGDIDRTCPACHKGTLHFKLGRFGAFISCSEYPDCKYTKPLEMVPGNEQNEDGSEPQNITFPKVLGNDPESGFEVSIRKGPYGVYMQLEQEEGAKPKRAPLPKGVEAENVDIKQALTLLSLPKEIGNHPKTGDNILVGLGRFGPYLKYQGSFISIPKNYNFLEVNLDDAIDILEKSGKADGELIGKHPKDKEPIYLSKARFGKVIIHGKKKAYVPKNMLEEKITLEQAVTLLKETKSKK